jgi:hypothetical protein
MDTPDLDLDEVFLDALEAVVLAALERIGDDLEARFRFFRRLLAVAEERRSSASFSVDYVNFGFFALFASGGCGLVRPPKKNGLVGKAIPV